MSQARKNIDVVTLGEPLIVLRAPPYSTLENSRVLELLVGGSEANVAVGVARLGMKSAMIGKVVNNPFGRTFVNTIRGFGVDVSGIVLASEGKTAFMFVELGAHPRPSRTIYDRKGSVTSTLQSSEVNWSLVRRAKVLHLTGITLALSEQCVRVVTKAIEEAKSAGTRISFDVNYRSEMWAKEEAARVLEKVLTSVDVLTITQKDAQILFDLKGRPRQILGKLKERFRSDVVTLTLGEMGAISYQKEFRVGRRYEVSRLNRYGAGDSFVAGFLYGYLNEGVQMGLDYGSAMAAIKLTVPNENLPLISKQDVDDLIRRGRRVDPEHSVPTGAFEVSR